MLTWVTRGFNIGVKWYDIRYITMVYIYIILCHICRNESKDKQGVIIYARGHKSSCSASVDLYTFIPTFVHTYYIMLWWKVQNFFLYKSSSIRFKNSSMYLCHYYRTLMNSAQCLILCYNIARRHNILCTIKLIRTISDNYAIGTARTLYMDMFSHLLTKIVYYSLQK